MPDSFDKYAAAEKHGSIIRDVEQIRDMLSSDVIDYYYSDPVSEDEEREKREGMRRYLNRAAGLINDLLRGKLRD